MNASLSAGTVLQTVTVLIWHEWENGCVVFNPQTGETHMLDLTSAYLLRLIESESRALPALARQMAVDLQQPQDEAQLRRVVRLAQNFLAMGVIEPVP